MIVRMYITLRKVCTIYMHLLQFKVSKKSFQHYIRYKIWNHNWTSLIKPITIDNSAIIPAEHVNHSSSAYTYTFFTYAFLGSTSRNHYVQHFTVAEISHHQRQQKRTLQCSKTRTQQCLLHNNVKDSSGICH